MERSIEKLSHFSCEKCNKWFSISDAPEKKTDWVCPWCGSASFDRRVLERAFDDLLLEAKRLYGYSPNAHRKTADEYFEECYEL